MTEITELPWCRHGINKSGYCADCKVESLITTIGSLQKENEQLLKFSKSVIQTTFDGCDLDGGDIQERGVKYGLLIEEKYDPDKHGSDLGFAFAPGDTIYVYTNHSLSHIQEETKPSEGVIGKPGVHGAYVTSFTQEVKPLELCAKCKRNPKHLSAALCEPCILQEVEKS